MKFYIFSILLASMTFIEASATKEIVDGNQNQLHDIWILEVVNGEKIKVDETTKSHPMIEIYVMEKRIHGNTSCNTINGNVEIEGNKINFYDIMTTEMACPGDLEQTFLSALGKVNNYKIEKLKLHLYQDDCEIMIFQKID